MPNRLRIFLPALLFTSLFLTAPMSPADELTDLYPADDTALVDALEEDIVDSDTGVDLDSGLADLTEGIEEEPADTLEDESGTLSSLLMDNDPYALPKDVVMVLDNSGSMKKNDPDFLATQAVSEFISSLDSQTRIAIVIFDQDISLAVPLTTLSLETRDKVLGSLDKINYRGLFTDSPAAVERAIYELKNNGRAEAQKSIVFMTDGIVDTGKPDVDLEKSKWLKEDLAADAADESIKVFGIAFTEDADFQLIQSIAQKTDGEYYRALVASDLQTVFKKINEIINTPPEVPAPDEPYLAPPTVQVEQPAPVVQQPVIIEVPAQTAAAMSKEERVRSTIMIVAAAILFITLLAIVYLLLRRSREQGGGAGDEPGTDAFINDIHNLTGTSQYQLGQKPTMFGRVAGKDTEHLNYLVVPESTIGRRHALIEYKDYGFWISDQGSINGTFINDQLITGEVCLKHGDKIRLHKFEFEFVMPEMDDAGMTVVSNTQFAGQAAAADAATVLKDTPASVEEVPDFDPAFDITGSVDSEPEPEFELDMGEEDDEDEEETLIRGDTATEEPTSEAANPDVDDEDETIVRDDRGEADVTEAPSPGVQGDSEDETLLPGSSGLQEDQNMTIRKEVDEALDDFFDIDTDSEDSKKS